MSLVKVTRSQTDQKELANRPRLKPAQENRWYVLATVRGEQQDERGYPNDHNNNLAVMNRRIWNGWACQNMDDDERKILASKMGLKAYDLDPLTEQEREALETEFARRMGPDQAIPDPSDTIDFNDTEFDRIVSFAGFVFVGQAKFASAVFKGRAFFTTASFVELALFASAKFKAYADFTSVSFIGYADFTSTLFCKRTRFIGTEFNYTTTYKNSKFSTSVPKFFNAKLHEDTDWSGISWPKMEKDYADDAIRAYERLKLEMSAQHRHQDELNFLALELEARAVKEGFWYSLPNETYRILSKYGYSISRPVISLLIIWGIPTLFYYAVLEGHGAGTSSILNAMGYSVANVFALLGFHRRYFPDDEFIHLNEWVPFVGGTQTVLGFILLFLLGLALRNRFRIK